MVKNLPYWYREIVLVQRYISFTGVYHWYSKKMFNPTQEFESYFSRIDKVDFEDTAESELLEWIFFQNFQESCQELQPKMLGWRPQPCHHVMLLMASRVNLSPEAPKFKA